MIVVYVVIGVTFLYFTFAIKVIQEGRVGIVERFGVFSKEIKPGFNLIIPGLDKLKKIVNIEPQKIVLSTLDLTTQDNKVVSVIPVMDFKVVTPKLCVYGVNNPMQAISNLVAEKLESKTSKMFFIDIETDIEKISKRLTKDLKVLFLNFGIELASISLKIIV
ncbi:MAG: SPFH domain-containing protein [Candidatus Izemoplasma sp.]